MANLVQSQLAQEEGHDEHEVDDGEAREVVVHQGVSLQGKLCREHLRRRAYELTASKQL